LGKGFKPPLQKSNQQHWTPFLEEAYSYISGLKDAKNQVLHVSKRKTGFIGFLTAIKSVQSIF
jgi:ribosomal protein S2